LDDDIILPPFQFGPLNLYKIQKSTITANQNIMSIASSIFKKLYICTRVPTSQMKHDHGKMTFPELYVTEATEK
jgi:hypothetical protein